MAELHRQMRELIGQGDLLVGRYRIGRRIGAGAYGMIFHAVDERSGESVAVKAIPPQAKQRSTTAIGRFQREMKVIRSLHHPNIISMHDWGRTERGLIFMVLEFVDGETLDTVVRDEPMEADVAIETTRQLASALHAAHQVGVIHRDLKPANVMLTPRVGGGYGVKVLDFGMAKVLSPLDDESSVMDLTSEGMAVGTPRYIAPEQARGLEVGPPADLYAVGLLMYEMFTGVQAVEAKNVKEAVTAHVSSEPLELAQIHRVPAYVRPVLWQLLEKDAEERVQSGRQLAALLDNVRRARDGQGVGPATQGSSGEAGTKGQGNNYHPSSAVRQLEADEVDVELSLDATQMGAKRAEESRGARKGIEAEGKAKGAMKARAERDRWFRPPRTVGEWLEGAGSMALIPLALMAVGAQASSWELVPRLLVGFAPPLVAWGLALMRDSADWGQSFGRLCWMCCTAAIIIAHVMGPQQLATALVLDPVWFLDPLSGLAGMETLQAAVEWISYQWAGIVFDLFGGGSE